MVKVIIGIVLVMFFSNIGFAHRPSAKQSAENMKNLGVCVCLCVCVCV